ncbi:PREDICTED: PH domain leucine-rich repeat-containing protein phosphatase 2-like, partial [Amphimedon queenslandica]|uniref:PH domain-containing protein n=1 Tax=Amphimedon queenslandica TaxID=400682 RepID=A0AAN0JZ19_AMPQE
MSRSRNFSLNFYDLAVDDSHDEEELKRWIKEDPSRGAIRVYQPGSTYSELTQCDTETHAEVIMSKCVTSNLYVYYAGHSSEPLGYDDCPLKIQNKFLKSLGYDDPERIQFEGTRDDLLYMFKFVAGREENKADERVQLTCTVKFKESSPFSFWSKRFCVLCGCQLHVFSSSTPKGKPSLTLDLAGGNVIEYETKKHLYCVQIMSSKKTVFLSFDSRYDQSVWLKRAAKVVTKHPLEADLSRCSLNRLPKYLFLNKNLAALNLSHNFMLELVEDSSVAYQPEGWINDIYRFSNLKILSLSDNNLVHFPVSVCNIVTLSELDLSCNKIRVIPQDIQKLKKLTTLLLHSNLISTLPYHLNNLQRLTTLVIAFNRFKSVPHIVKELESLRILIAAGNSIVSIPEDINRIQTLQILDLRMNHISTNIPSTLPELLIFFTLNLRGNEMTEFDMRRAKNLHVVNCSDNLIKTLSLHKGRVSMINARNN